ncbi:MAG TPA: DUF4956 domain-containing protein [Bacteroidales bacterium]
MTNLFMILFDKIMISNIEIIDFDSFLELIARFSLNTVVLLLLVRWLYYTSTRRKDYLFTFMIIGTIIFLLCYLLGNVKIQIGFALGLFAIFGIIRYRTGQVPIKEMTYLFLVVALSAINALVNKKISLVEILFSDIAIVLVTYGFEKLWLLKHESVKDIIYEKIELIKPDNYNALVADLKERTGIKNIKRVEVGRIDFLRDTCRLKIHYEESGQQINMADNQQNDIDNGDDD